MCMMQVGDAAGQGSLSDMGAQLGAQLRPQGSAGDYDAGGAARLGGGGDNAYLKAMFEPRDGAVTALEEDAEPRRVADPRLDPREGSGEGGGADYDADDFSGAGRGQVRARAAERVFRVQPSAALSASCQPAGHPACCTLCDPELAASSVDMCDTAMST